MSNCPEIPGDQTHYFPTSSPRRKLLTECCDPRRMFAVTKENSPMGKVLWYDGEFYHSHTVNNDTYPLFVQVRRRRSCNTRGFNAR